MLYQKALDIVTDCFVAETLCIRKQATDFERKTLKAVTLTHFVLENSDYLHSTLSLLERYKDDLVAKLHMTLIICYK